MTIIILNVHRFVNIEVWPLNKGQGKKIISYFCLKDITHDEKVNKSSYWKKWFVYNTCESREVKN